MKIVLVIDHVKENCVSDRSCWWCQNRQSLWVRPNGAASLSMSLQNTDTGVVPATVSLMPKSVQRNLWRITQKIKKPMSVFWCVYVLGL